MKERVFVAWERNSDLAENVAEKLRSGDFVVNVGGELHTMSIDPNVKNCTHFIILVDRHLLLEDSNTADYKGGHWAKRRNNLMFKWAYLAGKFNRRLAVFLINERTNPPKELLDCHYKNINKPSGLRQVLIDEIAEEIVESFTERTVDDANKVNKIEVFSSWPELKRQLNTNTVKYSELELAHRLLHSIDPSYYYRDKVSDYISEVYPKSDELRFVCDLIKASDELFKLTDGLKKPLDKFDIDKLRDKFDMKNYASSKNDENFKMWFEYFCEVRLSLICLIAARSEKADKTTRKKEEITSAKLALGRAKNALEKISEEHKEELGYVKLYMGYIYLNSWSIKSTSDEINRGDDEKATAQDDIIEAMKMHRDFSELYKEHPLRDEFLVKYFEAEYHTRHLNSASNDIIEGVEEKIIEFIERIDYEEELSLLRELREKYRGRWQPTKETMPSERNGSVPDAPKG